MNRMNFNHKFNKLCYKLENITYPSIVTVADQHTTHTNDISLASHIMPDNIDDRSGNLLINVRIIIQDMLVNE